MFVLVSILLLLLIFTPVMVLSYYHHYHHHLFVIKLWWCWTFCWYSSCQGRINQNHWKDLKIYHYYLVLFLINAWFTIIAQQTICTIQYHRNAPYMHHTHCYVKSSLTKYLFNYLWLYGACNVWCMYGTYATFENNFSALYGACTVHLWPRLFRRRTTIHPPSFSNRLLVQ